MHFRLAYEVLTTTRCANVVWKHQSVDRQSVVRLLMRVGHAIQSAEHESRRPTVKDEREGIEDIVRLATSLRGKLRQDECPLPHNWSTLCALSACEEDDDQGIAFSWHWTHKLKTNEFGMPLIPLTSVLDLAIELANDHLQKLPPRAAARDRSKDKDKSGRFRNSLVANLHWQITREFGSAPNTVVAAIATAICDAGTDHEMSSSDVSKILTRTPAVFRNPTIATP